MVTKCSTCINVIYTFRTPSWLWNILGYCVWRLFALALLGTFSELILFIRGESSLIKFIYVWPAFRVQYKSEKCHIFRHSQSFGTRALFFPEDIFAWPNICRIKRHTKHNQQLWSRDKVLGKNCFGFTVAGELNWICEGGVSSSVCGGGLLEICNEAASFDLTWSPSPGSSSFPQSPWPNGYWFD